MGTGVEYNRYGNTMGAGVAAFAVADVVFSAIRVIRRHIGGVAGKHGIIRGGIRRCMGGMSAASGNGAMRHGSGDRNQRRGGNCQGK
jgi:hypothetical protein